MGKTNYKGIDYGFGKTNINDKTGIRYGVIPQYELPYFWEDSEPEYGNLICPECEQETIVDYENELHEDYKPYSKHMCYDYVCKNCKLIFDAEDIFPESPLAWVLDDGKYFAHVYHDDVDIFVEKSPYFTYAQFCSPCAPGAVYLMNPLDDIYDADIGPSDRNNRGYCFGHNWFESGIAPYPVYDVKTGELVKPE